jgi:hypothetical protein
MTILHKPGTKRKARRMGKAKKVHQRKARERQERNFETERLIRGLGDTYYLSNTKERERGKG